jgi:Xaa-Pro aminopeptidase
MVLDAQTYTASQIVPGKTSLSDLDGFTQSFFSKLGVNNHFTHGVTHFVDTQVHGSGDTVNPIKEGMVFVIEPGLYYSSENIGVRIEDMFTITHGKLYRLMDGLPADVDSIEGM